MLSVTLDNLTYRLHGFENKFRFETARRTEPPVTYVILTSLFNWGQISVSEIGIRSRTKMGSASCNNHSHSAKYRATLPLCKGYSKRTESWGFSGILLSNGRVRDPQTKPSPIPRRLTDNIVTPYYFSTIIFSKSILPAPVIWNMYLPSFTRVSLSDMITMRWFIVMTSDMIIIRWFIMRYDRLYISLILVKKGQHQWEPVFLGRGIFVRT